MYDLKSKHTHTHIIQFKIINQIKVILIFYGKVIKNECLNSWDFV